MTRHLQNITRYALYALIIFTPLARGSVHDWAITTIQLITLIALTAFLLEKNLNWNWRWIQTPLDKPILCLLLLCLVSTIFSVHCKTSFWSMVLLLNYLTIFYLTTHTVKARSQTRQLVYLIIGIALLLSIFGLFKRFGVNPFPWWAYNVRFDNPEFVSATFTNHNHLVGYLEMAIPLFLGLFLIGYSTAELTLMVYLTLIMFTAMILTLSRGGWISCFLGLLFMASALIISRRFRRKSLFAIVASGLLAAVIIVLASTPAIERIRTVTEKGQDVSFHSRVVAWGGVVKMIKDYPLLGTGPGTFALINTQYQPPGILLPFHMAHNDYLQFVSEAGIFIIPIIIWIIVALYQKGFHKLKNPSRFVRGITLGALSGLTAILVHSIIDFNLHIPANAILFTVLAAIVAAPVPSRQ